MERKEIINSPEITGLRLELEKLQNEYDYCDFNDDPKDMENIRQVLAKIKPVCEKLLKLNRRDIVIEVCGDVPDWIE